MNYAIPVPPLWPALPEIILAVGALALVLFGAFKGERSTGIVRAAALGLLLFAMAVVLMMPSERVLTFSGSFVFDGFAKFMKALILIGSATALYLSSDFFRREKIDRFEYPILIVLATTGMLVMSSANDLIALYMGLELLSLSSYVIAAFHRDDARSTEAGLKYFMLGALSSGMLLYGASLVYGFTGTVQFDGIAAVLQGDPGLGAILGLVFVSPA
jgi:NADH-quinone oxidoreductase subunit N